MMYEFNWISNPILTKCARVRLRRHQIVPLLIVTFILAGFLLWVFQLSGFLGKGAIHTFVVLQAAILLLAGTSQVSAAVGQSVDSGMLDFHRIAPLPPKQVAFGFLLGGPIREYLVAACLIPFELICVALGEVGLFSLVLLLLALILNALLFHALSMAEVFMGGKASRVRRLTIVLIVLIYMFGGTALIGYGAAPFTILPVYRNVFSLAANVHGEVAEPTFYGIHFPIFLRSLLFQLPVLGFAFAISVRKIRRERIYSLSKPASALLLCTMVFLTLGSLWDVNLFPGNAPFRASTLAVILLIATTAAAMLMMPIVTPDAGDYTKSLRRAVKIGRPKPSSWDDLAANSIILVAYILIVAAATGLSWFAHDGLVNPPISLCLGLLAAITMLAHYGCALQFMLLAYGRKAPPYFGLYLFLVWVVPLLGGVVLSSGGLSDFGLLVTSISPLASIPVALGDRQGVHVAVSVVTGLLLVAVFVGLLTKARRELQAQARAKTAADGSVANG